MTSRWRRVDRAWLDRMLAVLLLAEIELEARLDTTIGDGHRALTGVAAVAFVAPVLCCRRRPGVALVACASVAVVQAPLGGGLVWGTTGTLLPPLLLAYHAGTGMSLRRGLGALSAAVALLSAAVLISSTIPGPGQGGTLAQNLAGVCVLPFAIGLLGRLSALHASRAEAFTVLAERVAFQRAERADRAAVAERLRIGLELQDILAQDVSALTLQAGVVRELVHRDPSSAAEAVLAVERAGRAALADLRRTLGLLREPDELRSLTPPRLRHLAALSRAAAERGLDCTLPGATGSLAAGMDELPVGIDLIGYRIVEAALTAAATEGAHTADVTIDRRPGHVDITIHTDRLVLDADALFTGIAERVALYEGELRLIHDHRSGATIHASIPYFSGAS